ncbi:MAG: hypothetical protein J5753_05745, partial [Oscillospiraceae bacterium]|nr:hypothetical protein [Oscillospiraceae bacterium]
GVSLSLDGTIHINFYTKLNDSVKKAVLSGPYYEEEITDFQKVQGGAFIGYTKLSYAVNATQRTDKVSLKLYDKDGNLLDIYNSSLQKVPGSVIRYSVKDYFESYTGEARAYDWEALTEERNTLVEWLERYMKAAENYFLGKTHTILPENYTPRTFDFVNEIKSAYKLGMVLNSGTDLLIYTDADRVVLSESPNDVDLEKYTDKDGRSCFIIRNIPASKTVDTQEIRINGESYYVCPRDYCYYAIQQCEEGDATWDLMWAFYEYSKAAEYYTFDCTDD